MRSVFKLLPLLLMFSKSLVTANPTGPSVIAGEASCLQHDYNLQVTASDQAIIHWQDFSVAQNERIKFIQPNANSAVLNRVTGDNLSEIHGTLQANGKVYVINPNGIIIGSSGVVDVSSFIASTLDITNEAFMNRGEMGFKGSGKASIVNLGVINAWDGDVVMIAFNIQNTGEIHAANGLSGLATGNNVLLKPAGEERIFVYVSLDDAAEKGETGIANNGRIESLKAELKSDGNLYAMAINTTGHIDATGVKERNGAIYLVAKDGEVDVSGTLIAKNNDTGGSIHVLGDIVDIKNKANIDVSGLNGGGEVLLGGDLRGENPAIYNAMKTLLGEKAIVNADCTETGKGGKIVLWSDGYTRLQGTVTARGGLESGDGGFIEISGKGNMTFDGSTNLRSIKGSDGTLPVDPKNITIISSGSDPIAGNSTFADNAAAAVTFTGASVVAAIDTANLVFQANTDITIDESFTTTSTNNLTLQAGRSITFNAARVVSLAGGD